MEKAERIVIFGNGRLLVYYVRQIRKSDYIIGVDRAAYWLITHGVVPNVAIGDFDSVS
ncbi:thiamine diphosphokinase, partial [Candidatus Gottesmanbacteria bacterium]|nr:thiamine diphosphokinase [Candidatus Gottesmanbacteria bacterium]